MFVMFNLVEILDREYMLNFVKRKFVYRAISWVESCILNIYCRIVIQLSRNIQIQLKMHLNRLHFKLSSVNSIIICNWCTRII